MPQTISAKLTRLVRGGIRNSVYLDSSSSLCLVRLLHAIGCLASPIPSLLSSLACPNLMPCGFMQSSSMPGADRLAVATHGHDSGKCCRDEYFGLRVRLKDDPAQAINIPVNSTVGPSGTGNPGLSPPWMGH